MSIAETLAAYYVQREEFDLDGNGLTEPAELEHFDQLDTNNNGWLDVEDKPHDSRAVRDALEAVHQAGLRQNDQRNEALDCSGVVDCFLGWWNGASALGHARSAFTIVSALAPPEFHRKADARFNLSQLP